MSLNVSVRVFGEGAGEQTLSISTAGEVRELVARLSTDRVGSAVAYHDQRPLWIDEEQLPDHELVAAIRDDGWGAMSYWDRDTARAFSKGDVVPKPGWGDENITPPKDAWIRASTIATALEEFLRTRQRPQTLDWQTHPEAS